jgi:SAM-dependent methyltransferase
VAVYGRDFAELYAEEWSSFTARIWPLIDRILAHSRPPPRTWLDLCCGAGTLLQMVCARGFDVVGLDSSPHQLGQARVRAPRARLIRGDVRAYDLRRRFDVITCLFDSFNYLTDPRELISAVRTARRHLAPRGVLLFDVNTAAGFTERYRSTWAVESERQFAIIVSSYSPLRRIGRTRVTGFVRNGRLWRRYEEEHEQRAYELPELGALLRDAGLTYHVYDGDRHGRVRKDSGRLLFVCRRGVNR